MSMHMIRGVQVHGSGKKKKRDVGWARAVNEHEKFLKKMGVGNTKSNYRYPKPDLSVKKMPVTSNKICPNGLAKETETYTGNEIAGIVTTHKSNLMPIRKDNKNAAIDAANMRR